MEYLSAREEVHLFSAAQRGDMAAIAKALGPATEELRDERGRSLLVLHEAASNGHVEVVRLLGQRDRTNGIPHLTAFVAAVLSLMFTVVPSRNAPPPLEVWGVTRDEGVEGCGSRCDDEETKFVKVLPAMRRLERGGSAPTKRMTASAAKMLMTMVTLGGGRLPMRPTGQRYATAAASSRRAPSSAPHRRQQPPQK